MERDALSRKVIEAKYGDEGGGWCTKPVLGTYGVSVWKSIRSGKLDYSKFLRFDVGDGTWIKFWEDVWCRDCSLKEAFTELYSISRAREFFVSKVMCFSKGRLHWDIWFCRPPHDWESESFDRFWVVLYSTNVQGVGDDKLCWKPAMRRGFEVRGFYHSLSHSSVIDFTWKMVWQSKVPPRVAIFSWIAALGKILTMDNFWKRHIVVLE